MEHGQNFDLKCQHHVFNNYKILFWIKYHLLILILKKKSINIIINGKIYTTTYGYLVSEEIRFSTPMHWICWDDDTFGHVLPFQLVKYVGGTRPMPSPFSKIRKPTEVLSVILNIAVILFYVWIGKYLWKKYWVSHLITSVHIIFKLNSTKELFKSLRC